jgi:hypothetical protein
MNIRVVLSCAFVALLLSVACGKKNGEAGTTQATAPMAAQQPGTAEADKQTPAEVREVAKATVEEPSRNPLPLAPLIVPAGTALTVRLDSNLSSKSAKPGDSFTAALTSPVVVNGTTVIPAGATARGTVVDAKAQGKFKGEAILSVKLTNLLIKGNAQAISTSTISQTQKGKGKRTAAVIGGGTAGGALIGGLAGGGKGAAIGAVVGAGAGTVGAAATGGKDVEFPAESALTFKLAQALTLK